MFKTLLKPGFDVNRRLVYAMRSIGQLHYSTWLIEIITLPLQMQQSLQQPVQCVMQQPSFIRMVHSQSPNVLCHGTWQRRGHSSLNGCVTTLSIDTGKYLDVEILTKVCHGCQKISRADTAAKEADLQERHKCKANYQGSAASMETVAVKRMFNRSKEINKLQHTEYFGDGDSKAYQEVQNCYENIHIEKKECVGHVQKRVGTALRNLKKKNKGIGG